MRSAKLGLVGLLIVGTALTLLWITEAVPRSEVENAAPKALLAVGVLVIAGIVWSELRGSTSVDDTDKRVP